MARIIFFILFILTLNLFVNSQELHKNKELIEVQKKIVRFFVKEGYFVGYDVDTLKGELFYATELIRKSTLKIDRLGVYWIGLFQSHSKDYLMICEDSEVNFYSVDQVSELICAMFSYSRRHNLKMKLTLEYIGKIIDFYNYRTSIKHSEIQ